MFQNEIPSWPNKIKSNGIGRASNTLWCFMVLCLNFTIYAQDPSYIETVIHNVDGNNNSIVTRTYSDGLGNEIQTQLQVNGIDSVVLGATNYDLSDRPLKRCKPVVANKSNLNFIANNQDIFDAASTKYSDVYAYSSAEYYDEALGRIKSSGDIGSGYAITQHPVRKWYFGVPSSGTTSDNTDPFDDDGFIKPAWLDDDNLNGVKSDGTDVANSVPDRITAILATAPESIVDYLIVTKDADGNFTQILKDVFGRTKRTWAKSGNNKNDHSDEIISRMDYDIIGNLTESAPPTTSGYQEVDHTFYNYDALGQLLLKNTPDAGTVGFWYDNNGLLHEVSDANSRSNESDRYECKLTYDYDGLGRILTATDVKSNEKRTKIRTIYDDPEAAKDFLSNSAFSALSTSDFNALLAGLTNTAGRAVASIAYDNDFVGSVASPEVAEKIYKGKVIDLFSYDDEGHINIKYKSIPNLPLQKTEYTYDLQGKIVAEKITAAPGATPVVTQFSYDQNGRLFKIVRDSKEFARYTYDNLGHLLKKTFMNSSTANKHDVKFDYDIRDNIKKIETDDLNFKEELTYNANATTGPFNGNISEATYTTKVSATPAPVDASLHLLYTYDNANRLTGVTNTSNTGTDDEYDATITYLNDLRIAKKQEGASQSGWTAYSYYDKTNRLKGIVGSSTKDPTSSPNFIYDDNGNMIFDRSKSLAVKYDWRNMPVKFYKFSSLSGTISTWNDVNLLIRNNYSLVTNEITVLYDASGQRVKKEVFDNSTACTDPSSGTPGLLITNTAATNPPTLLVTQTGDIKTCTSISTTNSPIPAGALEIVDAATSKVMLAFSSQGVQFGGAVSTSTSPLSVNYGSNLVIYYNSTGTVLLNSYGGYVQITGTLPDHLANSGVGYVDNSHVFVKDNGTDPYSLSYITFPDGLSRVDAGKTFELFLKDHLGSVRAVMTEGSTNWQMTEANAYKAFGARNQFVNQSPSNNRRAKFIGKEFDEECGINLFYFGARYYDPETGLWTATDPEEQYSNPYSYCHFNPFNFIDPFGLADQPNTGVVSTKFVISSGVSYLNVDENTSLPFADMGNGNYLVGYHDPDQVKAFVSRLSEGKFPLGTTTFLFVPVQNDYDLVRTYYKDKFEKSAMTLAELVPGVAVITGTVDLLRGDYALGAIKIGTTVVFAFLPVAGRLAGKMAEQAITRAAEQTVTEAAEQTIVAASKSLGRLGSVGATPGKASATGRKVIERMTREGKIMDDPVLGKMFMDSKGEWRQLKFGDMSHKVDAVSWWNSTGRNYGAKAKEVREWMLDPENYVIDYFRINRSAGAKLTETYLPPLR